MPSAQKPAGAEDAERALSRDQPVAADAAAPTPANQGSASAAGAEFTDEDLQQDPPGNGDLLELSSPNRRRAPARSQRARFAAPTGSPLTGGSRTMLERLSCSICARVYHLSR